MISLSAISNEHRMKLILLLLITTAIFLTGCNGNNVSIADLDEVFCDAETVKGDFFVTKSGVEFAQASTQSSDKAKSGSYSVKLNADSPYGMTFELKNVKKGDAVRAKVWKFGNGEFGSLIISDEKSEFFNAVQNSAIEEDGWTQLTVVFNAKKDFEMLKVFCMNAEQEPIYFDDLNVERIYKDDVKWFEENKMSITIPQTALDSISNYRDQALTQGVISDEMKEYFMGELDINGEKAPIELRIKGDWTDHLVGEKWSYRIKTDEEAYRGMKTFSIQAPETRKMISEWYAHKLFEREGILSTRYDFVNVEINGETKGVYAIEEHFDKQLLESQNRREGPIIKFDETGMWQVMMEGKKDSNWYFMPLLESSQIISFKEKRTYKKPNLHRQFVVGQSHLDRFRNRDQKLEEYLDVDQMAKFIALIDLVQGGHSLAWHNMRFYVNPVTNLLEPIGFDCQPGAVIITKKMPFLGEKLRYPHPKDLVSALFENVEFRKKYAKHLQKFTSEEYLKEIHAELDDEVKELESVLQFDYGTYFFDYQFVDDNAKWINKKLPAYIAEIEEIQMNLETPKFDVLPEGLLFPGIAVNAFREAKDSLSRTISLQNYHSHPVKIIGYSSKAMQGRMHPLDQPINLAKYTGGKADEEELILPGKPNRIFYTAANVPNQIFNVKPIKFGAPKKLNLLTESKGTDLFEEAGDKLILKAGNYSLTEDVIIPKGKKVIFEAGVKIDLIKNAAFISRSPVIMNGTASNRIVVKSSDHTGNGFTVLTQGEYSEMNYVTFDGLNTLLREYHQLTGAVSVYEGLVFIDNCEFKNNVCEDGLNLIRSKFKLLNSTVENTFADGFDGDFCSGIVRGCTFINTGNDAIDVSGSYVFIEDCKLNQIGDKGISGGEQSRVFARNTKIDQAVIGVASKDNSDVTLFNLEIDNTETVYAAFMKKWEYGPAKLKTKDCNYSNEEKLMLLDKGSKIRIDKREEIGEERIDVDAIYAPKL